MHQSYLTFSSDTELKDGSCRMPATFCLLLYPAWPKRPMKRPCKPPGLPNIFAVTICRSTSLSCAPPWIRWTRCSRVRKPRRSAHDHNRKN